MRLSHYFFLEGVFFTYQYYGDRLAKGVQVPPLSRKKKILVFFSKSIAFFPFYYILYIFSKKGAVYSISKCGDLYYMGHKAARLDEKADMHVSRLEKSGYLFAFLNFYQVFKYLRIALLFLSRKGISLSPSEYYFVFVYVSYYALFVKKGRDGTIKKVVVVDDYIPEVVAAMAVAKDYNAEIIIYSLHQRPNKHIPPFFVDKIIYWQESYLEKNAGKFCKNSMSIPLEKRSYKPLSSCGNKVVVGILLNAFYCKEKLASLVNKLYLKKNFSIVVRFHPRSKKLYSKLYDVDDSNELIFLSDKCDVIISMCSFSALEIKNLGLPVVIDVNIENNDGLLSFFPDSIGVLSGDFFSLSYSDIDDYYKNLFSVMEGLNKERNCSSKVDIKSFIYS